MKKIAVLVLVSLCLFSGCERFAGNSTPQSSAVFSDSEQAEAAWWGEYRSEKAGLGIVNYTGHSFHFQLTAYSGEKLDGVAAILEEHAFTAEYMDLLFTLSMDSQTVTVTQTENREDQAQRAALTGTYLRYDG